MQVGIHTKLTVTIMSFSCYHCEMNLYQSVNYQRLIQWYIQPHTGTGSYLTLITITGDTVTGIVSRKEVRKTAPAQVSTGARLDWAWLATPQHQRHTRAAASVGTSDSGLGGGGLPNVITVVRTFSSYLTALNCFWLCLLSSRAHDINLCMHFLLQFSNIYSPTLDCTKKLYIFN